MMMRSTRLTGAALRLVPYGDEGSVRVTLWPHAYLRCGCGGVLYEGVSTDGAGVFLCHDCERIVDQRRVA
jgi:hypothetical protein